MTWFLPNGRGVGTLGLINRHYPMGFLTQMSTPFDFGLDKRLDSGPAAPTN